MKNADFLPYSLPNRSLFLLLILALAVAACVREGEDRNPSLSRGGEDLEFTGDMFRGNLARTGVYDERGPSGAEVRGKWRFETRNRRVEASPAVWDSTAYIGSLRDHLYAVDARTGEERWRSDSTGFFRSSPAVVNGTVYVGNEDRHLYAFDAESGTVRWRYETSGSVRSAPVVTDSTVYMAYIQS